MKLKSILLVMVAAAGAVQAQQKPAAQSPAESRLRSNDQPVPGDDGGQAFVIATETGALINSGKHDGAVISEPRQYSIFLGRGWAKRGLRAREAELANLAANIRDQETLTYLDESGVKNLFGVTLSTENLKRFEGDSVSDLQIQSELAEMLNEGTLRRPDPNALYVVFLEPGLQSTLGSMIGRKHYLAYHNFFNVAGLKVHYVVVLFAENRKVARSMATRAFLTAVLNPTGSIH